MVERREKPLIRPSGAPSPRQDGEKGKVFPLAPRERGEGGAKHRVRGRMARKNAPHPPSGHLLPARGEKGNEGFARRSKVIVLQ